MQDKRTGSEGELWSIRIEHAEIVSFADLVDVYFGSQDPLQVNGQGPDRGSQYRSIIFYQSVEEKKIIDLKIAALEKKLGSKVAAEVKPFEKFNH